MIRHVEPKDVKFITNIYNEYVRNSVVTFETEPVSENTMRSRISEISSQFPYFVYETDGEVIGYCYAHAWKEKAAYKYTAEVTVYLSPLFRGKGIGKELMLRLIDDCRENGYHALIACITSENKTSSSLYLKLGFKQVSYFKEVGMKFERWLDVSDYELLLTS
ncbi:N-acetyltransferase family protein [Dysgonomonas sp. 216]|uniref:GNAT family N-acetyltransferase n=1 Tax=Dysgonomonas sp. 216 TaxID=2302934 RepID=UPI0013D277C8|nr:GNAT family N-acetyltransferase [Dysgonomonas sp. 216]NDW19033.1 N-acetyltransferase family protein [Dysgonomonas sp. 216]